MNPDWEHFLYRLRAYPNGTHRLLPPCPEKDLELIQEQLGKLPSVLIAMLRHFNGARLFDINGPLFSLFGVSTAPPLPPLQWAPEWYIDKFTPAWRKSHQRPHDWVIAITNYGGLIILNHMQMIQEWDTAQSTWARQDIQFSDWINEIFDEGDTCLRELNSK